MKKVLALLLSLTLVISMFTGCGKSETTTAPDATTAPAETTAEEATTPEATTAPEATVEATAEETTSGAAAKTGLAIISSIAKSTDAGEEEGLGQVDSLVVAVLVGEDGKILDCAMDSAQTKINFSKEGKITTDLATAFKSKQELGTEYGMLGASAIGKEWNEQADAFAAYVVGKTIDEVKGIAVTAEGVASDADLVSSVTVHIGDFIAAVEKAVTNAQDLGAKAGDKIGLGISTDIAKSKDAAADADGVAEAYSYYNTVTTDADGKITSSIIDASISDVTFTTAGVITSDLAAALQSKQELKDAYGMKKASAIGKEWYEQANAFSTYVTGKTIDEVKGIAISAEGLAADTDLVSSVTVHIGSFITVVDKAVASAAK